MILIVKILAIGIVGTFLSITLKKIQPEFSLAISIVCCAIIVFMVMEPLNSVMGTIRELCEQSGLQIAFFEIILKILGISFLTQIACNVANDSGQTSVSTKLDFAGKVIILSLAMPIVTSIFNLLMGLVK